jgi:hypothetical protein
MPWQVGYIYNMTQMSCNFKEQSKIVRMGGIPLWGEGGLKSSQATPQHVKNVWMQCADAMRVPGVEFTRGGGGGGLGNLRNDAIR